jgi:hypothetical protein
VPGWDKYKTRREELSSVLQEIPFKSGNHVGTGDGQIMLDDQLGKLLEYAGVDPEAMVGKGLQFVRRKLDDQTIYFIANHGAGRIDGWIELASPGRSALIMDPMTGRTGRARIRAEGMEIYLQMDPGETRILRIFSGEMLQGEAWPVSTPRGEPLEIKGPWDIEFIEGGPYLPGKYQAYELESWTDFDLPHTRSFAGAARYSVDVDLSGMQTDCLLLDLGDVRESARIWVNRQPAGVLVAQPYRLDISEWLREGVNEISIEVTNLSANRIRDLDIRGKVWRKFYDINFVNHLYEPFDASTWPLKPSGLLGPVKLIPFEVVDTDPGINH